MHYKYLIIGGGMTADSAVNGIRQVDQIGTIGIFTSEKNPPYNRPPLSKALWKGEPLESIWRNNNKENTEIHLSRTIVNVDVNNKTVVDNQDSRFSFDKLLFATGGKVRKLPFDEKDIIYYRTLDDYQKLRELTEKHNSFLVIGGGFIGSEVAAALSMNNKNVTMIFPDDSIGTRIYPKGFSLFLNDYFRAKDVEIISNDTVTNIERIHASYKIKTKAGKELNFDAVIAGIGIIPDTELAQSAGIKVDNGIIVNEFLQTSRQDVYAAGDVANFYSQALGTRIRAEHEDNANTMGETVGKNMAGEKISYHYLPFFYSDLFELSYEAVGELNSNFETVEDWKAEYQEGIVYYVCDENVRGVLLLNTWGKVDDARKLIKEKKSWIAKNLKGRIQF